MNAPFEVRIYSQPWDGATHIAFLRKVDGQTQIAKPILLEFEPIKEFEPHEATLKLNPITAKEFLQAMSNALEEHGTPSVSASKISGKLEATEKHLEDMRKLVFMEKK